MALLISPMRDPLSRDNGTWLSQGVNHWLCIGLMNSVDEKEPFSGCKVTMVSKNGRRLLSGVSMVNFKAEFRLMAVKSTNSGVMRSDEQATKHVVNILSAGIIMSLPSSMADFVPSDYELQKAYLSEIRRHFVKFMFKVHSLPDH